MTISEIEALTEYQKDVFMTKDDGNTLGTKLDKIQTTLDGFAKQSKDNSDEIKVLNKRMKSAEDWIDQTSLSLGQKFEH